MLENNEIILKTARSLESEWGDIVSPYAYQRMGCFHNNERTPLCFTIVRNKH